MKIFERKNLHQAFEWKEDILRPNFTYEITCPKCASVLHFKRNDFETVCLARYDGAKYVNPKNPLQVISNSEIVSPCPKYPDGLGRCNYIFEITLHCPVCGHLCIQRKTDYYLFEEQYKVMTHIDMLNFFKTILENDIERYRKLTMREIRQIRKKEREQAKWESYYDDD